MAITFRVYDMAKRNKSYATSIERYTLYVPTPRNKVKEWGFSGMYLGFSFKNNVIIKCSWGECDGVKNANLGGKIDRKTLPLQIQNWIDKLEKVFNKAVLTMDWEEWNRL